MTQHQRPSVKLESTLRAAKAWLPVAEEHTGFVQGAIAACEWLLGQRRESPVSNSPGDASPEGAMAEIDLADEVACLIRSGPVTADFARGAQHALMWAYQITDEPPVDDEPPVSESNRTS